MLLPHWKLLLNMLKEGPKSTACVRRMGRMGFCDALISTTCVFIGVEEWYKL